MKVLEKLEKSRIKVLNKNEIDDYLKDVDLVTLKFLFDKGGLDFNK